MKMKTSFSTVILLLITYGTFAQTNKGNFVLSGNTNLNFLFSNTTVGTDSIQTGKIKDHQFAFSAAAGYFVIDNLSAGVSATYSYDYTSTSLSTSVGVITRSFTIMPQFNYYLPVKGNLKPFVGIGAGYVWQEEKDSWITDNENVAYSMSGTSIAGGAGVSFFMNRSISFDLGFQYFHNHLKDKLNPEFIRKQNAFAGTLGVSVYF